jgi:hypothetical protein
MRFHTEQLHAHAVLMFADALDIPLWPKIGAAWMPKGPQEAIMTPGNNAKHSLAGALCSGQEKRVKRRDKPVRCRE